MEEVNQAGEVEGIQDLAGGEIAASKRGSGQRASKAADNQLDFGLTLAEEQTAASEAKDLLVA